MLLLQLLEAQAAEDNQSQMLLRFTHKIREDLTDPNITNEYLKYNIAMINSDIVISDLDDWSCLRDLNMSWNGLIWKIEITLGIENGESCLFVVNPVYSNLELLY